MFVAYKTERRREVRQVTFRRGTIEQDRFRRLSKVKDAVGQYQKLPPIERTQVVALLSTSLQTEDSAGVLQQWKSEEATPSLADLEAVAAIPKILVSLIYLQALTLFLINFQKEKQQGLSATPAHELASQFNTLFLGYKANVAKLLNITVDSADRPPSSETTQDDEHAEKVMSKFQHELTLNEGRFWSECGRSIASLTTGASFPEKAEIQLDLLLDRSQVMSESFERRSNAPTSTTYAESKEILRAMGISCVEAQGAIEAEALASAMVLGGLGDYVVSEDTVSSWNLNLPVVLLTAMVAGRSCIRSPINQKHHWSRPTRHSFRC